MAEILSTLDSEGTLDGLPIVPEMAAYCGHRYRVLQRIVQFSIDGAFLPEKPDSYVRHFRNNDVVTLELVRCSGANHGGCQRACAIFWKEAWLKKIGTSHELKESRNELSAADVSNRLRAWKTTNDNGTYYCQSSELLKATLPLSGSERFRNCFRSVAAGNVSVFGMAGRLSRWLWWRLRIRLFGEHAKGKLTKTPSETLSLHAGELVEIKSLGEIIATLDVKGRNRGLHFSGDQRRFCGGRYRVLTRADNYIAEGTGEMKHFKSTVILEDVLCDSSYYAFGGCCRSDVLYWHEIWLKRVNPEVSGPRPSSSKTR